MHEPECKKNPDIDGKFNLINIFCIELRLLNNKLFGSEDTQEFTFDLLSISL